MTISTGTEVQLTSEQRVAVESTSRDILLEAGAGSGKTSTTVARYMRLLDDGIDPHAILVFTFTDKAATELREKVRTSRHDRGTGGDFSMSSAWVGTFHAICIRILQAYPIAADVDPKFRVLDDVNAETVKARAFNLSLVDFMSDEEREATVGLFRETPLRETISDAYEELRSRGHISPKIPDFQPTDPAMALRRLSETVNDALALPKVYKAHLEKIQGLDELFRETDFSSIRCSHLQDFRFKSSKEELADHCEAREEAIGALAAAEGGDLVRRHLAELLEIYGRRYSEAKRNMSMLDYEDLQLITVRLLEEHPAIAAVYRERFGEIMVDEFQDTNRLQLELIRLLRGEDTTLFTVGDEMQAIYGFRHADVQLFRERRNAPGVEVLPLSANFRSQAPVIAAINEIGEELDHQAASNHGPAVPGNRHQFAKLTVGLPDDGDGRSDAEMVLTEKKGWKPLDLGGLSPAIGPEQNIGKDDDGHFEAEALCLAHRLRALIDDQLFRQSEVVILLRAKTRIGLYRDALEQVGLSPYVVGGTGFWKSREATDVKSMLSVLANPLDDEALIASLTSPACGLSSDALWILRRTAGYGQPIWDTMKLAGDSEVRSKSDWLGHLTREDVERIMRFTAIVDDLRSAAPTTPLASTVERAVTATGYDLVSLLRAPDGTGFTNVRRVMTLAHEFEATSGRDLREFLNWIELSADLDTESPAAAVDEESEVIRLMTIHKAKGLEFDLVCLPDLKRSKQNRNDGALLLGRAPDPDRPEEFPVGMRLPSYFGDSYKLYDWNSLAAVKSNEEADEELRLFHVAMTRARQKLVLSGITTGKPPKKITESTSMADRMIAAFDIDLQEPEAIPVPPPGFVAKPEAAPPAGEIEIGINRATAEIAAYLKESQPRAEADLALSDGRPPLRRPQRMLYPDVPLSFTALSEYIQCPANFYASRVLRLEEPNARFTSLDPEDQSPGGREDATNFGSAVHDLFEAIGGRRWEMPDREVIDTALRARSIDPQTDGLGDRAETMIRGYLKTGLSRRIAAGDSRIEIPLLARIGGVTIRGFADLLLKDPVKPLILDYKTNRLDGREPARKMTDYLLQRDLYALAVFRSLNVEAVETAYVFLDAVDQPVLASYLREDVDLAESNIEAVVGEITAGRFFGGPDVTHQPCGECWACDRLRNQIERAREGAVTA